MTLEIEKTENVTNFTRKKDDMKDIIIDGFSRLTTDKERHNYIKRIVSAGKTLYSLERQIHRDCSLCYTKHDIEDTA